MTTDSSLQKRQQTEQNQDSKLEIEYTSKTTPGKWDLKWRAGYRIVRIECEGRYLHIENQATGKIRSCNIKDIVLESIHELWSVNPEFGRASKFINHPNNLPDITPDI